MTTNQQKYLLYTKNVKCNNWHEYANCVLCSKCLLILNLKKNIKLLKKLP